MFPVVKRKIHTLLNTKRIVTKKLEQLRVMRLLPDRCVLDLKFYNRFGRHINWETPQTYNEKLQWLKLYNRRPEYTMMVDKYEVKNYVAKVLGNKYVIPTYGVWRRFEDIDFNQLPNQFVLKTTHSGGSSGVVICRDKKTFDFKKAKTLLQRSLRTNTYLLDREWPYKNVPRRIIAEKYIAPVGEQDDLPDYKFFCFDGEVKALFVATGRQNLSEDVKFDFFDENYTPLPFQQGHNRANKLPAAPRNFELMKRLASTLSKGIPHVRVDFYEVGESVLFGELTFFHFSGMMPFEPEEWDYHFGMWLNIR